MGLPERIAAMAEWVSDGVGWIPPTEGHRGMASLVIAEGDDVVVVDAGLAPKQRRALAPHTEILLLTHTHTIAAHGAHDFDHIWAPRVEAEALDSIDAFMRVHDVAARDRDVVAAELRAVGFEAARVQKRVDAGGILSLADHEWHLVALPGTSPGMMGLLDAKRHILWAGVLDGTPPFYGYPTSDANELERTAQTLVDIPVAVLLTARAPPQKRGIKPMYRDFAETIRRRDRVVLDAIADPSTPDELAAKGLVTGAPPATPLATYHERIMVEKHLARLLERDYAVARQDGRFEAA